MYDSPNGLPYLLVTPPSTGLSHQQFSYGYGFVDPLFPDIS